jgi:hypothetical protein
MNALEKYAAKQALIKALKKAKVFGKKVRGDYVKSTSKKLEDLGHKASFSVKPPRKGGDWTVGRKHTFGKSVSAKKGHKAAQSSDRAVRSQDKARKQLKKGALGGLAGLAALGIGAKVIKGTKPKGVQSAAKRLSSFAKKNKRALAIGGGAAGGAAALGAILNKKKK